MSEQIKNTPENQITKLQNTNNSLVKTYIEKEKKLEQLEKKYNSLDDNKIKKFLLKTEIILLKQNLLEIKQKVIDNFKKIKKIKQNSKKLINNLKNNIYEKYSLKLEKEGLSSETKNLILSGINKYLLNKIVIINGKKIKFTKNFIEKNKKIFIENFKNFVIFLMNIESYGGKNVENKDSSAKGPIQWIDGWKDGKKTSIYSRETGDYSPFETALRRADRFFNNGNYTNFKSIKTPDFIKNAWKNKGKLDIKKFDTEKQIQLMFIDFLMKGEEPEKLLMGVLVGNKWSSLILYKKYWHTNVKKGDDTSENLKNNFKNLKLASI